MVGSRRHSPHPSAGARPGEGAEALVDWERATVAPVEGSAAHVLRVPLLLERRPAEVLGDMLPAVSARLGLPASWAWEVSPAAPPMVAIGAELEPGSLSLAGDGLVERLDAKEFRRVVDDAAHEARRMIDALASGEMAGADTFRRRLRHWG